jgi:hypothetical protein
MTTSLDLSDKLLSSRYIYFIFQFYMKIIHTKFIKEE